MKRMLLLVTLVLLIALTACSQEAQDVIQKTPPEPKTVEYDKCKLPQNADITEDVTVEYHRHFIRVTYDFTSTIEHTYDYPVHTADISCWNTERE